MHHRRWSKADNQMSKSRQNVECFKYFKQNASSESCRIDLSTDEFIQCMHNTQISFKVVQKDSNNNTMQIEEKQLYWFKDVLTYCFAWYHEQSAEVNHDQKIEWHSRNSSHAIKCSNESEMQVIHDLDVRSINESSSHSVKLWNQICDLHAKLKCCQSIQSSLTRQISAYAENEKNVELHNQMNTQLSKESRDITSIQWTNEWHVQDKFRHITEISHFIHSFSILQCKFNWKMQSIKN